MKIARKQAIGENLLYLMVWMAIILVPILNSQMMAELHVNMENVLIAWRQIAPYLVIFLVHNAFLAPHYMLRRKYIRYVVSDLAFITLVFWIVKLYEEHFAGQVSAGIEIAGAQQQVSFSNLEIYWNILLGFFMTGANTGIKLIYQSMRDEQQMEELKRQNLQAEMNYLKYQINPHFFMNTLNNIHALIDIDAEYAKKAVIELSKMMRYVLYESGHETIPLAEEIQFLRNYIELMRIRYTDDVDIRAEYPQDLPGQVFIPPLLLIVFVENAFKHGISYNRPSFIRFRIGYADEKVTGLLVNSRHTFANMHPAGIGLENVRKRLDLIYGPKNYSLEIRESEETYTVHLEIPALHA